MDTMTLAIAGVAALAILLIAIGVATSGGSGISDRLERDAAVLVEGGFLDVAAVAAFGQKLRGGDYLLQPSMTALRILAEGF